MEKYKNILSSKDEEIENYQKLYQELDNNFTLYKKESNELLLNKDESYLNELSQQKELISDLRSKLDELRTNELQLQDYYKLVKFENESLKSTVNSKSEFAITTCSLDISSSSSKALLSLKSIQSA